MSVIDVELRLTSPQWQQTAPSGDTTESLWVHCDTPCPDPTDPKVSVSHPGRLTAIRINDDEVVRRTGCAPGPCSGPLRTGVDGGRRLIVMMTPPPCAGIERPRLIREPAGFWTPVSSPAPTRCWSASTRPSRGAIVRIDRYRPGPRGRLRPGAILRESDMVTDPEEFSDLLLAALDAGMGQVLETCWRTGRARRDSCCPCRAGWTRGCWWRG